MDSYEIDQTLKSQKYNINFDIYLNICQSSPQLSKIKYNPYENFFEIWTKDNYYWQFFVYRKENKI